MPDYRRILKVVLYHEERRSNSLIALLKKIVEQFSFNAIVLEVRTCFYIYEFIFEYSNRLKVCILNYTK